MWVFQRGKGGLTPLPVTIEHDCHSEVDAGFWGASACLAHLSHLRKHLRNGEVGSTLGVSHGKGWRVAQRALSCALSFS